MPNTVVVQENRTTAAVTSEQVTVTVPPEEVITLTVSGDEVVTLQVDGPVRTTAVVDEQQVTVTAGAEVVSVVSVGTQGPPGPQGPMGPSGSLAQFVWEEVPAGTVNGSNAVFTLSQSLTDPAALLLWKNGLKQTRGEDYTVAGAQITFLAGAVPLPGDSLHAMYAL